MNHLNRQERIGAGLATGSVLLVGGSVAASSLLGGYPVLGGQGIRYLAAGLLLAVWARLRRKPLPRPAGREWAWLAGLAVIGLAGCSVLLIEATRMADPASVGVVIGAAPLVIVIAAAVSAGNRPTRRVLLAAAVVTAGSAAAQFGGAAGLTWSGTGLLLSVGALGGAAGSSLLAAPVLPRLGALAVTIYSCGLAGILLLAAAAVARAVGGPPVLRTPTATQLAALSYLAVAVTAVVFMAWFAAMQRLGVDRTGLFNGLIPSASLAAVALVGTGTITTIQFLSALTVLVGVVLGLGRTPASHDHRRQDERRPPVRADGVVHNDPMDHVAVPERLRTSVRALGPAGSRWLEDLPDILASLAADWSIGYGRPLGGGNAAYVIEAVTADGRPVVAKVALPAGVDGFAPFEQELEALRLAAGGPYAQLIRHDVSRRSLLLERLGPPLASLGWPPARQLTTVASTLARGTLRGLSPNPHTTWESPCETGTRNCSPATPPRRRLRAAGGRPC